MQLETTITTSRSTSTTTTSRMPILLVNPGAELGRLSLWISSSPNAPTIDIGTNRQQQKYNSSQRLVRIL